MTYLHKSNTLNFYSTHFISLIFIAILFFSCSSSDDTTPSPSTNAGSEFCINNGTKITGEGTITTSNLTVDNFTGITLDVPIKLTINQGTIRSVVANGHPNIIAKLTTTVVDNILTISVADGCYKDYELSITITIPTINKIKMNGSGIILVNDFTNQSELTLDVSGSGEITLNKFEGISILNANIPGGGSITCSKEIASLDKLNLTIAGTGDYLGFNLSSNEAVINISGTGNCSLTVKNKLNVVIEGSGNVNYKGTPTIEKNITGTGSVNNSN